MSIEAIYSESSSLDIFVDNELMDVKWNGRTVRFAEEEPKAAVIVQIIHQSQSELVEQQNLRKSLGEGSYEFTVEKEKDGTTTVSGSVTYEIDDKTSVNGEVSVDSDGNTSARVSVEGKF